MKEPRIEGSATRDDPESRVTTFESGTGRVTVVEIRRNIRPSKTIQFRL